jgi:hypothetical protein
MSNEKRFSIIDTRHDTPAFGLAEVSENHSSLPHLVPQKGSKLISELEVNESSICLWQNHKNEMALRVVRVQ